MKTSVQAIHARMELPASIFKEVIAVIVDQDTLKTTVRQVMTVNFLGSNGNEKEMLEPVDEIT